MSMYAKLPRQPSPEWANIFTTMLNVDYRQGCVKSARAALVMRTASMLEKMRRTKMIPGLRTSFSAPVARRSDCISIRPS